MMAIILAGGKGTRLKPYTMTIPKPLLPLGDVPILEVVLRQLAAAGVSRVAVACYKTDCYWQDIGRFDDYQQASADFVAEPERFLSTAGIE